MSGLTFLLVLFGLVVYEVEVRRIRRGQSREAILREGIAGIDKIIRAVVGEPPELHIPWQNPAARFDGKCSCVHGREEHGWLSCEVPYCPCEGAWSE